MFHHISILPKGKPYKFNQLFIWKYLTFFPWSCFDIIVLRVRIKKKKSTCVTVVDTEKHPFLARRQVSFPVDLSLKCSGVSVNCLTQWRTYYMPITMNYKTRMIHLAQLSPTVKAECYYCENNTISEKLLLPPNLRSVLFWHISPWGFHLLPCPSKILSNLVQNF